MSAHRLMTTEIQSRIEKAYLERLTPRIRKMRRLYTERNWRDLRVECSHLRSTAERFGFPEISELAARVETLIPSRKTKTLGHRSGAPGLTTGLIGNSLEETRKAVEKLLTAVDHVLITDQLDRN